MTEPRTPLTLEYSPEGLEHDEQTKPVVIIEPSFNHPGRVFVGIHPLGNHPDPAAKRAGVHLLPEDAHKVAAHLAKLLANAPEELVELPPVHPSWQERIEAAAQRATGSRPRRIQIRLPWPEFRFEFRIGRVVGIIGTEDDG